MATDDTPESTTRNRGRLALVAGCVLTVVLAALLAPGLAAGDIAGTPIDSVLPGEPFKSGGAGDGGGGFGALNPGEQTGVGGETGFDKDTFGSNDTDVHFEVESPEPSYWRTGSYATYTGSGWEQTGETTAFEPPLSPSGLTDSAVEFNVTLAKSARAVPTVWQPQRISGVDGLEITDGGAIRATETLDAGTNISGVSLPQRSDVDLLRAAGGEYPDELAERYTQLPAETPERVGRFTEELTADDETAYDAATTIQQWLRSEKEYSLQADQQSEAIADTFIFEMEAGYCEYFATAMTTMLRSQGIPARYTVGYSTGQQVDENSYQVRGMNAHAWVEVYFPDVGWVQFDPTPGGSRLEAQSDVLEDELGQEVDLEEPGSPGETFEPGDVSQETDPEESENDAEYDISLNRTAVPGLPVELRVTDEGERAPNMAVFVNGERVGTAGEDGTFVFTVPDAEELRISVKPVELLEGENSTDRPIPPPRFDDRLYSTVTADALSQVGQNATSGGNTTDSDQEQINVTRPLKLAALESNTTVDVETEASLSIPDDIRPGKPVTVAVTVADVVIPNATVTLDGKPVGTTDADGRVTVPLPAEPGNATLAAERGSVSGQTTVTVPGIALSVSTGAVPLPFAPATATVTAGGEPVPDAPIVVDGEQVATTGADGSADLRLPLSSAGTVAVNRFGLRDSETVGGLFRNAILVGGGVGLALGVPAVVVYRRNLSVRGLVTTVKRAVDRAIVATQLALLWAVRGVVGLAGSVPRRIETTVVYLLDAVRGRVSVAELKTALLAWVAAKRDRFGMSESAAAGTAEQTDIAGGIQQAWADFLAQVSVDDPEAHTPRELAVHAVEEDGHPAKAVRALLTAFRAVEYGSRPPREYLDGARRALDRLEEPPTVEASQKSPGNLGEDVSADGGQEADQPGSTPTAEDSPAPDRDGGDR